MPFVSESLIRAVAEGLDRFDAMLPQSGGPRGIEPLCAAYGPACREAIAASLAGGDLRAVGFHDRIRVGILPVEQVRVLADPDFLFFNVNTADDLAKADELWRRHTSFP